MAEGGKKDAAYILDIFDNKVMEYNPKMALTDLFYFDVHLMFRRLGKY
jgi:hypothetical protein